LWNWIWMVGLPIYASHGIVWANNLTTEKNKKRDARSAGFC
jgi:predicted outer membrane lipoprotein